MSQTTYNTTPPIAAEGEIGTSGPVDLISGIANDTNAVIPFGKFVVTKTAAAGGEIPEVELPNATGEVTGVYALGVVVRDRTIENDSATAFAGYTDGEVLTIMRRGRIWVISEDAVSSAGAAAFVRFVAGVGEVLGSFRTDADTSDAVALPGARFMTTCDAGGLVLLELDPQTA